MDLAGEFRAIREINNEIRRLHLGAYAPLRYVLPHKQAAYDAKYSTKLRGGQLFFRQLDREGSLIHLMRINLLKRMESSVISFALTLQRQLRDVEVLLARIDAHEDSVAEISREDIDIDDPNIEALLVGRKVKVLLQDVDRVRWRQDLAEDRPGTEPRRRRFHRKIGVEHEEVHAVIATVKQLGMIDRKCISRSHATISLIEGIESHSLRTRKYLLRESDIIRKIGSVSTARMAIFALSSGAKT